MSEAQHSLVIDAEVEAVDASGGVLPDVQVTSVYGSTVANMVIGPGETIDVLIFDGPGAAAVDDVRVTRLDVTQVEASAWPVPVGAVPLGEDGAALGYPAGFSKVALHHENGESADVRVVAIIWDSPETGQPQQAQEVIELSPLVTVPHGDTVVIDVAASAQELISGYAATNAVSLKAYYSV